MSHIIIGPAAGSAIRLWISAALIGHLMGFRRKIRSAGQLPSFGSIGDGLDNAMMKASGHLCRSNAATAMSGRPELSWPIATFDHIKIFHNGQRRQSATTTET
jgi:hypothetical protein